MTSQRHGGSQGYSWAFELTLGTDSITKNRYVAARAPDLCPAVPALGLQGTPLVSFLQWVSAFFLQLKA